MTRLKTHNEVVSEQRAQKNNEIDKGFGLWIQLKAGTMVELVDIYGKEILSVVTNEDVDPNGFIRIELFEVNEGRYRKEMLDDLEWLHSKGLLTIIHEVK